MSGTNRANVSSYGDVGTLHFDRLASILSGTDEKSAKNLCDEIDEKIDRYANGDLDHAADVMTLLWKLSKAGGQAPKSSSCSTSNDSESVSSLTLAFCHN